LVETKLPPHISEDPFHIFVNSVRDYAIFMLDADGYITTWNTGAERIKGYKASEIIGKHFSAFYTEEDVQAGKPQRLLKEATLTGRTEDIGWRVRKDGSRFWADVVLTAIRDDSGELLGFGKVTRDLTERKRVEDALHRSEERSRLFIEAVQDYAIFMLDTQGHVASWNVGAQRIKGYKAQEIMGQHFSIFYPDEDIKSGKPQMELEVAAKVGRFEDEGWRIRRDGSQFWANVIITAVRDNSGRLLGFGKVTRDFTERKRAEKALEESQRSLRELSLHLLRTQDEERRAIGREMHDSLGQYLSILKMRLDAMSDKNELAKPQDLAECAKLVDESVKEVRTVSYLLYPPMLEEMGLKTAIPWYLDGFSARSGISTTFEVAEDFPRISRDVELMLFRVLQECLTNVHKHSGSKEARVRLSKSDDRITLEVSDAGKGFPPAMLEEAGRDWIGSFGVGLRGMSERVRQLGGQLHVNTGSGGTQIRAVVPAGNITSEPN
jgi:PAS domain S-box-containing protein